MDTNSAGSPGQGFGIIAFKKAILMLPSQKPAWASSLVKPPPRPPEHSQKVVAQP